MFKRKANTYNSKLTKHALFFIYPNYKSFNMEINMLVQLNISGFIIYVITRIHFDIILHITTDIESTISALIFCAMIIEIMFIRKMHTFAIIS